MKYSDGTHMSVGDLIWWNEGTCKGRVAKIIESQDELKQYGLTNVGFFICADPSKQELTQDVFYEESDLVPEGIEKIEES